MIAMPVIAGLIGYLAIGAVTAIRSLPRRWGEKRQHNEHLYTAMRGTPTIEVWIRNDVIGVTLGTVFAWPIMIGINVFGRVVDSADPKKRERELSERESRIRDLERELGIKR